MQPDSMRGKPEGYYWVVDSKGNHEIVLWDHCMGNDGRFTFSGNENEYRESEVGELVSGEVIRAL